MEHSGEVPKLLLDEEFMQGSHRVVPLEALLLNFQLAALSSGLVTFPDHLTMVWNKKYECRVGTGNGDGNGTVVTQVVSRMVSYVTGQ